MPSVPALAFIMPEKETKFYVYNFFAGNWMPLAPPPPPPPHFPRFHAIEAPTLNLKHEKTYYGLLLTAITVISALVSNRAAAMQILLNLREGSKAPALSG